MYILWSTLPNGEISRVVFIGMTWLRYYEGGRSLLYRDFEEICYLIIKLQT